MELGCPSVLDRRHGVLGGGVVGVLCRSVEDLPVIAWMGKRRFNCVDALAIGLLSIGLFEGEYLAAIGVWLVLFLVSFVMEASA